MSARRALITGITGQDGSYLAERLLADGDEVMGIVRPPAHRELPPALAPLRRDLELVEGDLADPTSIAEAIRRCAPDEVFHLAAPTFVPASWEDPAQTMAEIAGATAVVLAACRDTETRVLTVSSPEVFGDAGESPQREDSPKHPRSPYGVAKLAAHELVGVLREGAGLHGCAVVTYNHESSRRPARFVTRKITRGAAAIKLGLEGEVVLGDLEARRDWTHASDIVRAYVLAMRHDVPQDYVLGSGVARTVGEFAEAAFACVGLSAEEHIRTDPAFSRGPEPTLLVADPSRAREDLGWEPEVPFDDLVREMVEADLKALRRG